MSDRRCLAASEKAAHRPFAVRSDQPALRPRQSCDDVRDGHRVASSRGPRTAPAAGLASVRSGVRHRRLLPGAARAGHRPVGFDFSFGMLASARTDAPLVQADALRLPGRRRFGRRRHVRVRVAQRRVARGVVRRARTGRLGPVARSRCWTRAGPTSRCCRAGHGVYFERVVPVIGGLLSDRDAYAYLPKSMAYLPPAEEMLAMLRCRRVPVGAADPAVGGHHAAAGRGSGMTSRDDARRVVRSARRVAARAGCSSSARGSASRPARADGWHPATSAAALADAARGRGRVRRAAFRRRRRAPGRRAQVRRTDPFVTARIGRAVAPTSSRASSRPRRSAMRPSTPVPPPHVLRGRGGRGGAPGALRRASEGRPRAHDRGRGRPALRSAPARASSASGRPARVHVHRADRGGVLVGASPELLVSRHGSEVRANPLAGSAPRSGDPGSRSGERGSGCAASAKNREEHAIGRRSGRGGIAAGSARRSRGTPSRSLHETPNVWHLSTRFRGRLREPAPSALDLARALHPTPAVGGAPTGDGARDARTARGVRPGCYAGPVGWVDAAATASGRSRCGAAS